MLSEELSPWVAVADLHAPRWRRCLQRSFDHHAQAIELDVSSALSRAHQFQLREALELFALGLRLDATRFITAVNGGVAASAASVSQLHGDRLRLHVGLDVENMVSTLVLQDRASRCPWRGFFCDWTSETSSEAFKDTLQHVRKLRSRCESEDHFMRTISAETRFQLGIRLRLSETIPGDLTRMISLLEGIDRRSFTVSTIHVQVESPAFDPQQLAQFVQVVDSWRDQSVVDIKLVLPGGTEDIHSKSQWSFLFDAIALQPLHPRTQSPPQCAWNVSVECASSPDHTTTALVELCLKALARTDQVSSLTVCNLLQDATSGGRTIRGQELANLMRFGAIETISWKDRMLGAADPAAGEFAFDDDASSNRTVIGSLAPQPSRIKSLMIQIYGVASSPMPFHHIPAFVGPSLEAVSIEMPQPMIPWSSIEGILIACPRLLRLTLKTVLLSSLTVSSEAIDLSQAAEARQATLQSLSLDVVVHDSCVVSSLASVLHKYGAGLRKLSLRCRSRTMDFTQMPGVSTANMLTSCGMLNELHLSRINVSSLVQWLSSDQETRVALESLVLDGVVWGLDDMVLLFRALASKPHHLAQSLRKLSITHHSDIPIGIVEALFRMLEVNRTLKDVTLIVPRLAPIAPSIQHIATSHQRRSKPLRMLSVRQKLAVLSVLVAKSLPWEHDGLARVFEFATPTERRRITVAFG